jgi:L-ribulose-5-phosphate 4-epimerase
MTVARKLNSEVVAEAKVELAAAFRAAAIHGFNEGIDNHFSLSVPESSDLFVINRYGPHWSEMRRSDLLTFDLQGSVIDGDGECELTAFMIHRAVHRARPTAGCVFHTHTPYATAVSTTPSGLETRMSQNSMYFHGHVSRVAYGGHADGDDEGTRIGEAIGDQTTVVMLEGHGSLVIGTDVADAWHKLYFLERACQVQVFAQSTGQELIRVPEEVAAHTAAQWEVEAQHASTLFEAVRRDLDRRNPGYEL